jgi:hypothetical protein
MLMRRVVLSLLLLVYAQSLSGEAAPQYGRYEPSATGEVVIVEWGTPDGQQRLMESRYKNDYVQLAIHFQPQVNPLYCGVASSVIVLNSMRLAEGKAPSQRNLEVTRPEALGGGHISYPAYSQLTFLNEATDKVKPRAVIELKNTADENSRINPGLTLLELKGVLKTYDITVDLRYADAPLQEGAARFRTVVKQAMQDNDHYVLVNFYGDAYGAPTRGHISPVAAYHQATDSVLILDVAGYKNPWYWVPVEQLYQAMHTKDGDNYRGYLVVSDTGDKSPGTDMFPPQ